MASDQHHHEEEDLQAQISAALAKRTQRAPAAGGQGPRIEPTLGLGGMGPGSDRGQPRQESLIDDEPAPEIPPAPVHFQRDGEDLNPARAKPQEQKQVRHGRSWLRFMIPIVGLPIAILIALFYYIGIEMQGEGVQDSAPLITAPEEPDKVKPTNEGGMAVEGMNSTILNQTGDGQAQPTTEQLLPPPEQPITPPAPASSGSGVGTATSGDGTAALDGNAAPAVPSVEVPATPAATPPAQATTTASDTGSAGTGATAPSAASATSPSTAATTAAPAQQPAGTAPATQTTATTPAAQPTQTQTASAGSYRVQLVALKSEDAAKAAWTKLQSKYPDLLKDLQLTIVKIDLGATGIFYRVQGGPLADRSAAHDLCDKFDQRGQSCLVVRP